MVALEVPTIAVPGGLTLRPFVVDDKEAVVEAGKDPYIPTFTAIPQNCDDNSALAFINAQHSKAQNGDGYSFAIAATHTNKAIGHIGLWLGLSYDPKPYIGYWVVGNQRGNRVAARSLESLTKWAFEELNIPELRLHIEETNISSVQTAKLAGYQFSEITTRRRMDGSPVEMQRYVRASSGLTGPPLGISAT